MEKYDKDEVKVKHNFSRTEVAGLRSFEEHKVENENRVYQEAYHVNREEQQEQ